MSALKTYVDYLLALSCEVEVPTEKPEKPHIPANVQNFLQAFLRLLDKQEKTTRRGVDAAIEALFTNPDLEPCWMTTRPSPSSDTLRRNICPSVVPCSAITGAT